MTPSKMPKIAILLTTYNSSRFLSEQLDSLLAQTCKKWHLYIRDDESTDSTVSLLQQYAAADSRITLLYDTQKRGAAWGFMWLLEQVEADYYMFCDHDDVWFPEKIESTLQKMELQDDRSTCPIIVATDLMITDSNLHVTAESLWQARYYRKEQFNDRYYHLFYNNIPGCTMMFNHAAKQVSLPFPDNLFIHDSWIITSVLWKKGRIVLQPHPMMFYRQHSHNLVGSKESPSLIEKICNIRKLTQKTRQRYLSYRQFTSISFPHFLFLKTKYLLLLHWDRFTKRKNNYSE